MKTIIEIITDNIEENNKIYKHAGEILQSGGLVAFPTETVYGLGANALDSNASKKVYAAKGRPSDNPLIVHICDMKGLNDLAREIPDNAIKLADKFWPGPLTMIFKKEEKVPDSITGGLDTVAIRMPSHRVASELIRQSGLYIAAPSANTSGRPSPTRAAHVIEDLSGKIDMIIQDDTVDIGLESTIVDVSGKIPVILRPGYITKQMLEEVVGQVLVDPAIMGGLSEGVVPKAPGMKYRHYAPRAELTIVEGDKENVVRYINEKTKELESSGKKVCVMTTDESRREYMCGNVYSAGSEKHEEEIAHNLFLLLREFDSAGMEYVYSESFPDNNVGQAVMNRLIKAAGHKIIHV
ncbi:MAG: L-threonylcarbamoyladenylate synthase [Lachnospira sp.]